MKTDSNLEDPDGLYEALCNAHTPLTSQESAALNFRLIFLLANQIGDDGILRACISAAARQSTDIPPVDAAQSKRMASS